MAGRFGAACRRAARADRCIHFLRRDLLGL